jgi:DNA modification methylase
MRRKPSLVKLTNTENAEKIHPELYLLPNPHFGDFNNITTAPKPVEKPYYQAISAGKNTYVYDAHTYHTKVPPQGIELLIEYYTRPGDVVLDPFCGSGMTGVATTQKHRKALLSDLSPAAVFIAFNLNTPIDASRYLAAIYSLLDSASSLEASLYNTHCRTCSKLTPMLYMVWSYGLLCNYCEKEFLLWDVARDERSRVRDSKIKSEFDCPHCHKKIKKRGLKRTVRYPVMVGYRCCQTGLKEATSPLDEFDYATLKRIEQSNIPNELWYPTTPLPEGINTKQPIAAGITTVDKMYTPRALWAMAYLWNQALKWPDDEVRSKLLFTLTSLYQRITVFSEFRFWGGSGNTANFNVPTIINEQNVFRTFLRKAKTISWYFKSAFPMVRDVQVSTQSACHLTQVRNNSVDYIFTDPPFGGNINYSEMNFLWESWLGVYTDNTEEAIINKFQKKGVGEYQTILTDAFRELRRVLKKNGWLTVVFHNSSDAVWKSLQTAITNAGFAIKGTQTFDKEHGTFKQFVSENAVGYDLVLHCKKTSLNQSLIQNDFEDTIIQIVEFIKNAVSQSSDEYIVRYLHVNREDEFDYRKLYAHWLAKSLTQSIVSVSFEEFRALVDKTIRLPLEPVQGVLFSE